MIKNILGVRKVGNNYQTKISLRGKDISLGTYYNEEAAAVIYNHIAKIIGDKPINENITMNLEEAEKYRTELSKKLNGNRLYFLLRENVINPWEINKR